MKKRSLAIAKPRRATLEPPEIFVRTKGTWSEQYARARLNVKDGKYVYLRWRDGENIRNFYLGQRKQSTLHLRSGSGAGELAGRHEHVEQKLASKTAKTKKNSGR